MLSKKIVAVVIASTLAWVPVALPNRAEAQEEHQKIFLSPGQVVLEVTGEVNNLAATPAEPLGSSQQFGYLPYLRGVESVFTDTNPANQNETTAQFTFFTEVTTTRVTTHGPFSIVIREGTTTLYRNTSPANFSTPDSFRSGTPIMISVIRQQVIVDTVEKTFTVENMNTITSTTPFDLDGTRLKIGKPGESFRTTLQGVLFARSGGTPPPTGHFAGYAVGVLSGETR
jgi:hypothetical protein